MWHQRQSNTEYDYDQWIFIPYHVGSDQLCHITVHGLEAVKLSSWVYLEAYTSILLVNKERLETFYGKEIIVANCDMVETQAEEILYGADKQDMSLLIVGDSFGTTTHIDIVLHVHLSGIPLCVIHNASIMNAIGACGLQLYNFSGRKIYEPPQYMSIPQAIPQLLEVKSLCTENVLSPKTTLVIALSHIGCDAGSDNTQQCIVCGTLEQLSEQPLESFGEPLHSLVIVGNRLHHLEVVYVEEYAVCREMWR
ncbi:Diphthine synthase [Pisolithus croceorrhizus]|nr:Diphthine synthase [Pisolithus croceorrhizus]